MSASTLTGYSPIGENSQATPGLFNSRFAALQANIVSVNSAVLNPSQLSDTTFAAITLVANSNNSSYIRFVDSAAQRSNYRIGSVDGGTADGLNIWDESGNTMIVSFSKQSVRFYQNVVGAVFDTGGALSNTLNAATFGTGADSKESRIQAAINEASSSAISRVYLSSNLLPYSASSVSFIYPVQMVREGGRQDVYDVKAYGAAGNASQDDTAAIQQAIFAAISQGGVTFVPGVTRFYLVSSTLTATLSDTQFFAMRGDGLKSLIYSSVSGSDVLYVDGSGVPTGRTAPFLADFAIAGGTFSRDGLVLDYTHRGTLIDFFVISAGRWAANYKACFLNSWTGGGATVNLGAVGNIPTQPNPKGMLRLGDGPQATGSNANSFHGVSFEGGEKSAQSVIDAFNATPIVVSVMTHGYETGDIVSISGVGGNTAADGPWIVTKVSTHSFSLDSSVGNGAYTSGGTAKGGVGIHIQAQAGGGNSYGNTFISGTAENNTVGTVIGPGCTLNTFIATDITGNVLSDWTDHGAQNAFIMSGSGGALTSFGGGLDVYGQVRIRGTSGEVLVDPTFGLRINNADNNILVCDPDGNVAIGDAAIPTSATSKFFYLQTSAGKPTGTPTTKTGRVPLHYDSTNDRLHIYNSSWRTFVDQVEGSWTPTDGSGAGLSLANVSGRYIKTGRQVTAWADVTYPATADATAARLAGLPFTANAAAPHGIGSVGLIDSAMTAPGVLTPSGTTFIYFYLNGTNATNAQLTGRNIYVVTHYATT